MATILVIQHTPFETPGTLAQVAQAAGHALQYVLSYADETVPVNCTADALIVMGGPMGVYEDERYPFLAAEIQLIQDALANHLPIIGICLGSQLLATALGGTVTPGERKEIGWLPVTFDNDACQGTIWQNIPNAFTAFHWHGDIFTLPDGARALASSQLTACQAFVYHDNAYGMLFHPEVTTDIIAGMVNAFPEELQETAQSESHIVAGSAEYLSRLQTHATTIFQNWVALIGQQ